MKANAYQIIAVGTASKEGNDITRLTNWALGIAGEAGEVADLVKKCAFHGHEMTSTEVAKELGDVLWYVAVMAKDIGYSLDVVMQMNIDKLKKRYPEGFSEEASINRESER